MSQNFVTLFIGLGGIFATLTSSFLGFYYYSRNKINPFREALFSKQLDSIESCLHLQGKMKNFITILLDSTSDYHEEAREDLGRSYGEHSELRIKSAAILPVELWIEISKLHQFVGDFICSYDEDTIDQNKPILITYAQIDTKIALLSRILLGVDELTEKRLKLYATNKDFKRVAKMHHTYFK